MKKNLLISLFVSFWFWGYSQPYTDYIGAGHNKNITVTSSDAYLKTYFSKPASAQNTINGQGLEGKRVEASRLLNQASFGATIPEINKVAEIGIEPWIDEQLKLAPSEYLMLTDSFANVLYKFYLAQGEDPENISPNPGWQHFRYSWWDNAVHSPDQLRQRMAYALSQILVISDEADIGGHARGLASYYDMLSRHALGLS